LKFLLLIVILIVILLAEFTFHGQIMSRIMIRRRVLI